METPDLLCLKFVFFDNVTHLLNIVLTVEGKYKFWD